MQANAPRILIPIFSSPFSNYIYAQNISKNRVIKEFLKIDYDMFYKVEWIPPLINLKGGDEGIFAFDIGDIGNSEFVFGNYEKIQDILRSYSFSNPYFNLEVSDVICDLDLHDSAIEEISKDIASEEISVQWINRERRIRDIIRSKKFLKDVYKDNDENKPSKFDDDFNDLYENPFSDKWSENWLNLWRGGVRREELSSILIWRFDLSPDDSSNLGQLLLLSLSTVSVESLANISMKWIERNEPTSSAWYNLWNQLRRLQPNRVDDLVEIGIKKISKLNPSDLYYNSPWMVSWYYVWSRSKNSQALIDIAESFLRTGVSYRSEFLSYVVEPLSRYKGLSQHSRSLFFEWLGRYERSTNDWADSFLQLWDPEIHGPELGVSWLSKHGGNTNTWIKVWEAVGRKISREAHLDLGFEWLTRSRWDLRTWPLVFVSTAKLASSPSERNHVKIIGERWLGSIRYGTKRKEVQLAVSYVEAMLDR